MPLHGGGKPEITRSAENEFVNIMIGLYSGRVVFMGFFSPPSKWYNSNWSLQVTMVIVRVTYFNTVSTECFEQREHHHGFSYHRTACFEVIIIALYVIGVFQQDCYHYIQTWLASS
jgi:hypothetical protein